MSETCSTPELEAAATCKTLDSHQNHPSDEKPILAQDNAIVPVALSPPKNAKSSANGHNSNSHPNSPSMPMSFSLDEMDLASSRGGRAGSLSKFVNRRRSTLNGTYDEILSDLSVDKLLGMDLDIFSELLDDIDSEVRSWLMQTENVLQVLREFVKKPVFEGVPHEEYGYYKNYFLCSEIVMRLYSGDDDLYESFSSDSSAESLKHNTIFGCQQPQDLIKWELLFSIFDQEAPLDEMQMLFYSKALVRLHDASCLEEGYVENVLKEFLPKTLPHFYSSTVKYMLILILQSYESVHPITAKNDAMEVILPCLVRRTQDLDYSKPFTQERTENIAQLLVDLLQANQADRLGAFCRREGGIVLSKYFVRDQFGTIRGFESMSHGYHNFLQFMFLEQLSQTSDIIGPLLQHAVQELEQIEYLEEKLNSSVFLVDVATEIVLLYQKLYLSNQQKEENADETNVDKSDALCDENENSEKDLASDMVGENTSVNAPESCAVLARAGSGMESSMYSLKPFSEKHNLWKQVSPAIEQTAKDFAKHLNSNHSPSVQVAVAKYLHIIVQLNEAKVNEALHEGGLIRRYFTLLEDKPRSDMLLIHIIPSISFILRDENGTRARNCPLTADLLDGEEKTSVLDILVRANQVPELGVYAALVHEAISSVFETKVLSTNNREVMVYCSRSALWQRLRGSSVKSDAKSSEKGDSGSDTELPGGIDNTEDTFSSETKEEAAGANATESTESKENSSKEESRSSSYYIKQVLQSPMFRHPMRLGSVIKVPERVYAQQQRSQTSGTAQSESQQRTFGWNSMLKRLKKSLVITPNLVTKQAQPFLALSHEPFNPDQDSHTLLGSIVIVDTSRGQDISEYVHHDGGVHVVDVPITKSNCNSGRGSSAPVVSDEVRVNVITSGYMYKSRMPETGQRHVWERCYFVLNRVEGTLSYYVSEAHARDRTFVRGTVRPLSVTEGIPTSVGGKLNVFGLQINTQGHGMLWLLVDSVPTRSSWLTQVSACLSASGSHHLKKSNSSLEPRSHTRPRPLDRLTRSEMKEVITSFYETLFGPDLKYQTPFELPAGFWIEEKLESIASRCILSSNLPDSVPYWGEFHGYQRLCDYWKLRDETVERCSGRVLRIIIDEEDESAVVMTTTTYRILRNSQIVTEESCDILSLQGREIVNIHCTFDSHRIAEAFRKEGVSAS
uniref:Uncharacterized protein AlNc14C71G4890 n=1 Tax=Albugo laibachii Nc14 TaxID=890382 RepID=F0WE29_9STRA|nr:conserved hypothetical protein [Albugo laibachii Nc14]|eukprot:CCA19458.1 conserved hypothetical protein [Albugo laibachii Nc14]